MMGRTNTARWVVAASWAAGTLSACGTHANDDIPQDLLEAIAQSDSEDPNYPSGEKGSAPGDVAPNVCVSGWLDPRASAFDTGAMEEICFADFWDPDAEDHRLLLVNTAAIWCSACQVEYGGAGSRPALSEEATARREQGLRILGTLFQDASRNPATPSDGSLWARTFDVSFPFGIDENFEMGAFADADVQPFNLLIDTQTMEIVLNINGDNPGQLWPAIDERLQTP